jgi:hypothetical protein
VSAAPAGRAKVVRVEVSWPDRTGLAQTVSLTTTIAGVPPDLAGTVGLPGDVAAPRRPGRRNVAIPLSASDNGNGTSNFTPPGAPSGTVWVFNNSDGIVTQICNPTCTPASALLLQGYVRFATGSAPPTAADAELPPSPAVPINVVVNTTFPTAAAIDCFEEAFPSYVTYYCAIPVAQTEPSSGRWSGTSLLDHPSIALTSSDFAASHYRVCRYTPATSDTTTPPTPNGDHPRSYTLVDRPLINQNFLVISAGNGSTAFACPGDGPGPTNTGTLLHQPAP